MTELIRVIERDAFDQLGEGLLWSPARNAVFWVDIMAPKLFSYDLGTRKIRSWVMPEKIGWAIERAGRDDFVIGLKSGFAFLQLDPFQITPIGNPEPDRALNRLNDAKPDHAGRIWAGSKHDADEAATGALYRLDADLRWSRHDDGYAVTNGPTFSLDGRVMYHTDSGARTVYAFDLAADGRLHNKRVFVRFTGEMGYPDGMTTDADGGIWIAHWGGGRVSRFHPDGRFDRSIPLPASQITNCVFAGEKLDRMFVTSAAHGTENEPMAGALFEVDPGTRGLPARQFAG